MTAIRLLAYAACVTVRFCTAYSIIMIRPLPHVPVQVTTDWLVEPRPPLHKTNNQASFGGSLLKNNMEVEAAMKCSGWHLESWTNRSEFAPMMFVGRLGFY